MSGWCTAMRRGPTDEDLFVGTARMRTLCLPANYWRRSGMSPRHGREAPQTI